MILTLTANPSIDRTVVLSQQLRRGEVHRLTATYDEAGGKGVNVARVAYDSGLDVLALFPSPARDPFTIAISNSGLPHLAIESELPVRANLTITEPDGTTTKINAPGGVGSPGVLTLLASAVVEEARDAKWVALSGSLPADAQPDFYARLVTELRKVTRARIAVDTSDQPLLDVIAHLPASAPDLLKPNAHELEQITGETGLEEAADSGDFGPAAKAARTLIDRGIGTVLTTLGPAGALLTTSVASWVATPPPIQPKSTVGAGDSALAGYLVAAISGLPEPDRLRYAVAYGSAATALPGTRLPTPAHLDLTAVTVTPLAP
ncbi:MAG: 1-phosphofructokinase family hexose kinase [Nocardiaceae bacterium]|nr:1-phosphofructokinase family hexose kinase [Nocardiaceae bacterium]